MSRGVSVYEWRNESVPSDRYRMNRHHRLMKAKKSVL